VETGNNVRVLLQTFSNPRPNLLKQLALSGPLPGTDSVPEENGVGKRAGRKNDGEERAKKKSRNEKTVGAPAPARGMVC
jgi:transcription initiation factor TFIID/TFIIF subunit